MAFLGEDGHGFWVRWREPGHDGSRTVRRRRFSTRKRGRRAAQKAAQEFLAIALRCEARGERWEPPRPVRSPLLTRALDDYIRDFARARSAWTTKHEALTLRVFRDWVLDDHDEPGVDILSRDLVADFYEHMRVRPVRAGRKLLTDKQRSIVTIQKNIDRVQKFWSWCHDHDVYGEHVGRMRRLDMPSPVSSPTRAPTWAEMDACVEACDGWQRDAAVVLRFTGLRVGQVMGLRWEHVDVEAGVLYFPGHLGKTRLEKQGRVIPLSAHLVEILKGWGRREGWLVETTRADDVRDPRTFRSRDMVRAWKKAGVRPEVWRGRPDHAFRKGFVSELKRARADPEAAEYLVGRKLGGERGTYVDPTVLPLEETVALIPPLGFSGVTLIPDVAQRTASAKKSPAK